MAESLGTATLELEGDLTPLGKSLDEAKRKAQAGATGIGASLKTGIQKAALPAAAALALIATGAVKAIDAASDLSEQVNKAAVVFRGSEKDILAWGETTAASLGISNRAALEAAGVFGNMLVPMGIARREAAGMSMTMVELAADMASFNNASPEETLDALRAGLAGETEPLRRFGVFLNEARIKQEAMNLGLIKGKEELNASQKAQATYSIILKDTADAQGDFARTSDGLANQERILRAELEDTAAALGQELLPAATDATGALLDLVKWAKDNETAFKLLVGTIAAFSAGILLANAAVKIYGSSLLVATGATRGLRLAMALTPWGAAITGAALLIGHLMNQGNEGDEAAAAMDRLTDAVKGYQEAIAAGKKSRDEVEDANLRLESAEIAVQRAIRERRRVDKDATSTSLERREADLRVAQAMNERRDAESGADAAARRYLKTHAAEIHAANRQKNEIEGLAKTYRNRLTKEQNVAIKVGKSHVMTTREVAVSQAQARDTARQYADRLRGMAEIARRSNPKLARTADLAATLADAWGRVVSLPQARSFVARFRVITTIEENRAQVGRNASGTMSWRGGATFLAERGPELIHLPPGTRVDSAMRTRNAGALGGEVHFHFPRYVGNRRELVIEMKTAVSEWQRANGGLDPF